MKKLKYFVLEKNSKFVVYSSSRCINVPDWEFYELDEKSEISPQIQKSIKKQLSQLKTGYFLIPKIMEIIFDCNLYHFILLCNKYH